MRHLTAIAGVLAGVLAVGAAALGATATPAAAQVVTGHVYDSETGLGISGAEVIVRDRTKEPVAQGTTDDDGQFRIDLEDTGLYTIAIERSGYPSDLWASVEVLAGGLTEVEVVITPDDVEHPRIVVSQDMLVRRLVREGYYQRKRRSRGEFIEPTEDDVRRRTRIGELIRDGARRVRVIDGVAAVRATRGGSGLCPLRVILDGIDTGSVRLEGRRPMAAREIQAIEVYWSESTVPARWRQTVMVPARGTFGGQTDVCGLVVIWLR